MKRTEYDRAAAERENLLGPQGGDQDLERVDPDEDFSQLCQLLNSAKLTEDEDLRMLRKLVNDDNRQRLHKALDKVLERLAQRRCTGDRKFLKNFGIRP